MAEPLSFNSTVQKAVESYLLANGFPAEGVVEFIGDSGTGDFVDALDVAHPNFDCTTSPGMCLSKHFAYDAYCVGSLSLCVVRAKRFLKSDASDIGAHYYLYWLRNQAGWSKRCDAFDKLGQTVCQMLNW